MERRAAHLSIRADAAGRRLRGLAARFGSEARIGSIVETIAPGAFAATLGDGGDVLALVDHDPSRLLARTRSGTLRLQESAEGLEFEIDLPETQLGRDTLALAERGDLGGMSFGFVVREDDRDGARRVLRSVDLKEISVVHSWPAYPETTVQARSAAACLPDRQATWVRLL